MNVAGPYWCNAMMLTGPSPVHCHEMQLRSQSTACACGGADVLTRCMRVRSSQAAEPMPPHTLHAAGEFSPQLPYLAPHRQPPCSRFARERAWGTSLASAVDVTGCCVIAKYAMRKSDGHALERRRRDAFGEPRSHPVRSDQASRIEHRCPSC